jgi:hypothetical protein
MKPQPASNTAVAALTTLSGQVARHRWTIEEEPRGRPEGGRQRWEPGPLLDLLAPLAHSRHAGLRVFAVAEPLVIRQVDRQHRLGLRLVPSGNHDREAICAGEQADGAVRPQSALLGEPALWELALASVSNYWLGPALRARRRQRRSPAARSLPRTPAAAASQFGREPAARQPPPAPAGSPAC